MERYVIALDAMGGDHAPDATVGGAVRALRRFEDISMILTGPKDRIEALLAGADDVRRRIEIVDCDEVITMDEHPMMAVRKKVNSSMVQAMLAVREKRAGAAVSAGIASPRSHAAVRGSASVRRSALAHCAPYAINR